MTLDCGNKFQSWTKRFGLAGKLVYFPNPRIFAQPLGFYYTKSVAGEKGGKLHLSSSSLCGYCYDFAQLMLVCPAVLVEKDKAETGSC